MSKNSVKGATIDSGVLGQGRGKVGGVVMAKNGVLRGSVKRKGHVRQKALDK